MGKSTRNPIANGDASEGYRLYKGDREVLRKAEKVLMEHLSQAMEDMPPLPPPSRREVLFQRAFLRYLADRHQRCVSWVWTDTMDCTLGLAAFRNRTRRDHWPYWRRESNRMVSAGIMRAMLREKGLDDSHVDPANFSGELVERVAPVFPAICATTRKIWRGIIGEMGPTWSLAPKCNRRTRTALEKHGLAQFVEGDSFVAGKLTAVGVALRDRWHQADAWRTWRQYKKKARPRR